MAPAWPIPHQPSLSDMERRITFGIPGAEATASWEGLCPTQGQAIIEARLALAEAAHARYGWDAAKAIEWVASLGEPRTEAFGHQDHCPCDYIRIPFARPRSSRRLIAPSSASGAIAWVASMAAAHRHSGSEGATIQARDGSLRVQVVSVSEPTTLNPPPHRAVVRAIRHIGLMADLGESGRFDVETGPGSLPGSATARAVLGKATLELLRQTGRQDLAEALRAIATGH